MQNYFQLNISSINKIQIIVLYTLSKVGGWISRTKQLPSLDNECKNSRKKKNCKHFEELIFLLYYYY